VRSGHGLPDVQFESLGSNGESFLHVCFLIESGLFFFKSLFRFSADRNLEF
jgi:hypothetical protein